MARAPKMWLRKQTGWYCTTINGQQIKLSQDKAEAQKAFHALLASDEQPDNRRPPFRNLADGFLKHSREVNVHSTFKTHQRGYLQSFCDHVKNRRAPDLRGEHVTAWLKANPTWGQSTRSLAIQAVKACLNWAKDEGKIKSHPLATVKQGQIQRP